MPEKQDRSMERLAYGRLEIKKGADGAQGQGLISGYGALFGETHPTSSWELMWDGNWNDTLAAGAFARSLKEHKARGTMPAMLWQHDRFSKPPVGAWTAASEDDKGLLLDGRLALKTALGAETYELMQIGAFDGLSIGFEVFKAEIDEEKKLRTITDVELYEISPVSIPAIAGARVQDVKSLDMNNIFRDFEKRLRDAGRSRTEAKRAVAAASKELAGQRDADDGILQALLKMKKNISGA